MKKYQVMVKTGDWAVIKAKDEDALYKKLATGMYGVLPIRGKDIIRFTPDNVKEIVDLSPKGKKN